MLSALSLVAGDEGHLEEAESLAREARRRGGKVQATGGSAVHGGQHRARTCTREA